MPLSGYLPTQVEPTKEVLQAGLSRFTASRTWVPTIVWPSEVPDYAAFFGHVVWWVAALVFSFIINILGPMDYLGKDDYSGKPVSDNTTAIGVIGIIGTAAAVIMITVIASIWSTEEFTQQAVFPVVLFVSATLGLTSAFYMTTEAFAVPGTAFAWICGFGMFFMLHSYMWLYSTCATLKTTQLTRILLPSVLFSLNLTTALAINGGDWVPSADQGLKDMSYVITFLGLAVLLLSAAVRWWIDGPDDGKGLDDKKLVNHPFKRSVLMTVVAVNAILQTWLMSHTTGNAHLFQFPATILVWVLTALILNPSGRLSQVAPDEKKP